MGCLFGNEAFGNEAFYKASFPMFRPSKVGLNSFMTQFFVINEFDPTFEVRNEAFQNASFPNGNEGYNSLWAGCCLAAMMQARFSITLIWAFKGYQSSAS